MAEDTLMMIYFSSVHSIITYGTIFGEVQYSIFKIKKRVSRILLSRD